MMTASPAVGHSEGRIVLPERTVNGYEAPDHAQGSVLPAES